MKDQPEKQTKRDYRVAVGVAVALLLVSGWGFRVMAARLAGLAGTVVLPRGTLTQLPLQISDWVGRDEPLDERIIQATDTDDSLHRSYTRRNSAQTVSLFIAYGVHFRDLMPHRPEVCYPGGGWTMEGSRQVDIPAADGSTLPAQIHQFSRGGLDAGRVIVLNYYDVGGQYCPDVSLLRSRAWRPTSQPRYLAQVQITAPSGALEGDAEETVRQFAAEVTPAIRDFLTQAVDQAAATNAEQSAT